MSNRLIIACIFLTSCVNHEYQLLYNLAKSNLVGVDDIIIDKDFIAERNYSFIKVNIGKSEVFTMTLLSVDGNEYEWIGLNGFRLKTKHGRVVETYGFDNNALILDQNKITDHTNAVNSSLLVRFDNPEAIFNIETSYEVAISEIALDKVINAYRLRESFKSTSFYRWNGTNTYWFDKESNLPLRTIHHTHPHIEPMEIDFYYKF